jgi:hypothetical protein
MRGGFHLPFGSQLADIDGILGWYRPNCLSVGCSVDEIGGEQNKAFL